MKGLLNRLVNVGLLTVVACSVGCGTFHEAAFNQGLGVSGYDVLVIPFRDSSRRLWYGESPRGAIVATEIKSWSLVNSDDARFVEGQSVNDVLDEVKEWTKGDIRPKDWRRLTTGLDARFVVLGDIRDLQTTNPQTVGFYDGSATASFEVIDVVQGRQAFENEHTVHFGRDDAAHIRLTTRFEDRGFVEKHLLRLLAERISKDLYGYIED